MIPRAPVTLFARLVRGQEALGGGISVGPGPFFSRSRLVGGQFQLEFGAFT